MASDNTCGHTSACESSVAVVWRGDQKLPAASRGLKVLGAPTGQPEDMHEFLRWKSEEQRVLFQRMNDHLVALLDVRVNSHKFVVADCFT